MKKLTKFGIITMSVFALNLVSQSIVQADETNSEPAKASVTLGITNSSDAENTSLGDNRVEADTTSDTSSKSDAEDANTSSLKAEEISTNRELQLAGKKIQPALLGLQQAQPQALVANQMVAISLTKAVMSM